MVIKNILFLFLIRGLYPFDSTYTNFQNFIHNSKNIVFRIKYNQESFNEKNETSGLFFLQNSSYTFDNKYQRITQNKSFSMTINKVTKQVIYDNTLRDQITIFDILAGNTNSILISDSYAENQVMCTPFRISEWGIIGKLFTDKNNGSPKRIILKQDEDSKVEIIITSYTINKDSKYLFYDFDDYEKIDLRE